MDDQARARLGLPVMESSGTFRSSARSNGAVPDRVQGRPALEAAGSDSLDLRTRGCLSPKTTLLIETPFRRGPRSNPSACAGSISRPPSDWGLPGAEPRAGVARSRAPYPDRLSCPCVLLHRAGRQPEPDHRGTGPESRDGLFRDACLTSLIHPQGPLAEPTALAPPCREDPGAAVHLPAKCFTLQNPARRRGHSHRADERQVRDSLFRRAAPASDSRRSTSTTRPAETELQAGTSPAAGAAGAGCPLLLVLLGADHAPALAGP